MTKYIIAFFLIVAVVIPASVSADVQVSGLADFVFRNSKEIDVTNSAFRGFSNFHTSRTRLFFDGNIGENTDLAGPYLTEAISDDTPPCRPMLILTIT